AKQLARRIGDAPLRQDFVRLAASIEARPDRGTTGRFDMGSVEESLDSMLRDADEQAEQLDASAAAREETAWSRLLPYALVTGGAIALIVVVVVIVRRGT